VRREYRGIHRRDDSYYVAGAMRLSEKTSYETVGKVRIASELKPRKLTKRVEEALISCSEIPKWRLQGLL